MLLSNEAPNALWVYRYFFSSEGKLQSAWSKWCLGEADEIKNVDFIESKVYLVVARASGTFLEVMSLESGATSRGSSLSFRLDQGVYSEDMPKSYHAATDKTTFTLPYTSIAANLRVVVRGDDDVYREATLVPHEANGTAITLRGDWRDRKLLMGHTYDRHYEFSPFFIRAPEAGGGVSADASGRLQLRYLAVDYTRAAYFQVEVAPRGRTPYVKTFSGRTLGVQSGALGSSDLATGRVRIPIMARNTDVTITIKSDSHLPSGFTSAEWEALFTTRARKV
jgi:hypothetical protein